MFVKQINRFPDNIMDSFGHNTCAVKSCPCKYQHSMRFERCDEILSKQAVLICFSFL